MPLIETGTNEMKKTAQFDEVKHSISLDHVLKAHFPNVNCPQQIKILQDLFFAGAAASYQILTKTPERADTLLCELVDHTEHMEASA